MYVGVFDVECIEVSLQLIIMYRRMLRVSAMWNLNAAALKPYSVPQHDEHSSA